MRKLNLHSKTSIKTLNHLVLLQDIKRRLSRRKTQSTLKLQNTWVKLHDALKAVGCTGHELEVYLVRLLFCLFAEDTTIFEKRLFQDYIESKTNADGSDLAHHFNSLFYVLNQPSEKTPK